VNAPDPFCKTVAVATFGIGTISTAAFAQNPAFDFVLSATEVYAGTMTPVASPNGLLEPGEGIFFRLESVLFSPSVGTIVHTPLGSGPVVGLATLSAMLSSSGGGTGTWTSVYVDPQWRTGAQPPFPQQGGVVLGPIHFLRLAPPFGTISPTNPIEGAMHAVWTPADYTPRTVEWYLVPYFSPWGSLHVHYGDDPTTGLPLYTTIQITTGPIGAQHSIHIVPSPAVGAVLSLSAIGLIRRRRRP
jgi:hypothetical protein